MVSSETERARRLLARAERTLQASRNRERFDYADWLSRQPHDGQSYREWLAELPGDNEPLPPSAYDKWVAEVEAKHEAERKEAERRRREVEARKRLAQRFDGKREPQVVCKPFPTRRRK